MKRGFWLYMLAATAGCIVLIISSYVGWFFFHLKRDISPSGEQWGQFGDFFGGILNPILSFITICILIKTSLYQERQNTLLEQRERNKRFEDRFYGMNTQVKQSFESLTLTISKFVKLDGDKILRHMEDILFSGGDTSKLNASNFKETIFPVIRQFYILLKMLDSEFEKGDIDEDSLKDYHLWLINSTDYKTLRFVIFSAYYYDSIQASKFIISNDRFIEEIKKLGFGRYIEKIIQYKNILKQ
ncbi:TPA: hypothetical protein ACPZRY_001752 [Yersinia enterocolitica]|uniref:hypothetical protein n=1 Tax=Yersinia enterocolitica TaxID=630 RepID=UPI0032F64A44|nr:hypothetical protein [Yersinia enterocolitica]EKN4809259.1 hypothetical protein [Yersinia enterocolitica]HDL7328743.1 hypothetical protein [Yersinia enterocolitica]HDL7354069.1 hypothetical protein [Yersinia enterocolitica]HDL7958884.1 hypothetical protein [Yersinia enterocolitica]